MAEEMRGVIDRFEGGLAAIVFDDGQRLDLPIERMPEGAKVGDALVLRMSESGAWRGAWRKAGKIELDDGQSIRWPGARGKGEARLTIDIDAEDTAARTRRVQSLLDDIFKNAPPSE